MVGTEVEGRLGGTLFFCEATGGGGGDGVAIFFGRGGLGYAINISNLKDRTYSG